MEKFILPISVNVNNDSIVELDLSIPQAVALNNYESCNCDPTSITRLFKRMTIGKKILLERCERYAMLKRYGSPADIVINEEQLIEQSVIDFLAAKEAYLQEMKLAG